MLIKDEIRILGIDNSGNAGVTLTGMRSEYDFDISYCPRIPRSDYGKNHPEMQPTRLTITVRQTGTGQQVKAHGIYGRQVLKSGDLSANITQIHIYGEPPFWLKDLVSRFERGELS